MHYFIFSCRKNLTCSFELTWYNILFVKINLKFLNTYIPLNNFKWREFKENSFKNTVTIANNSYFNLF